MRTPILVTGSHRSGTTWAGMILKAAKEVTYVHEPFHLDQFLRPVDHPFEYWFQYVDDQMMREVHARFDHLMAGHFPFFLNLGRASNARQYRRVLREQMRFLAHQLWQRRILLKDPIAFFSAEWLAERYAMDVLVMIRHPAAFCSSLKLKNWTYDFNHMREQPRMMERYLGVFAKDIEAQCRDRGDIIDQAILLWNCVHHTIRFYQDQHPNWIFRRHEDLSLQPMREFEAIYQQLRLDFSDRVRSTIVELSGAHNPVEQTKGSEFKRNSIENLANWKGRLSESEIARIRSGTEAYAHLFYGDEDWA